MAQSASELETIRRAFSRREELRNVIAQAEEAAARRDATALRLAATRAESQLTEDRGLCDLPSVSSLSRCTALYGVLSPYRDELARASSARPLDVGNLRAAIGRADA